MDILRMFFRVAFHLLPVCGVVSGRLFLTVALACLVGLAYVKAKKMRLQKEAATDSELKEELSRAQKRWEYLIFGS